MLKMDLECNKKLNSWRRYKRRKDIHKKERIKTYLL